MEIPHFALNTVNRITTVRTDPGGKGINISKVIAKLGGKSKAMGILAGSTGRAIAEQLTREVVVSMGGRGALYVTRENSIYAEGLKVKVGSTVGAGDSVVAALAYAADRKLPLTDLADLRAKGAEDSRYAALADIVEANNGLWCPAAEKNLPANFAEE